MACHHASNRVAPKRAAQAVFAPAVCRLCHSDAAPVHSLITVFCSLYMSHADQVHLRILSSGECSTSYGSRPCAGQHTRRAAGRQRRISRRLQGLVTSPHLGRAQRSSSDRQSASAVAAAHSLLQSQEKPADEVQSLPNFWQDSQDLARQADAPDGLPKLVRLNLDLQLVT